MKDKLEILRPLVEQFRSHIKQYKSAGYDEANVRVDFIDKYFEILDWDVRNTQGFSEDYREVVREDRVIIAGKPKAPDYSFRVGGRRKFFVEAKKPLIYIKEELEPAYQVRRYGYTAKLPLSVLTDFEEFAVYDTRIKPSKNDKASVGRLYYCTFEDYQKNFEFLYETFSKTAVLKGSFDRYARENKVKKGTSEVDREFLELISEWREKLAKNIAANNARADITLVNTAVQKIIDRIIFLRIAEDRGTEPYGKLKECGEAKKVYGALGELFEKARAKYNGDLFKPDDAVNKLHIENDALTGMFNEMYFPDCPYEFSVFPIEVLGNIYEQFLGKTIRLTEGHRAKIEEKPEVRKAGGVYYTPQYIVNYIVENTVGAVIGAAFDSPSTPLGDRSRGTAQPMVSRNETGDRVRDPMTPAQISRLKILDPACGSGSFLIGAYGYLLDYHLKYYMAPENRAKAVKEEKIYQIDEHHFHLTIKEKQSILLNNIYGVDIDPQAVEVTKLSLLLKLMENETKESEGKLFKHSDEKYLPNLSNNIKCGNSLIGSDFYDDKDMDLFGKDEIRKVNTFDWVKEFPGVFGNAALRYDSAGAESLGDRSVTAGMGGFDVVIGNPPYVRQEMLKEFKEYFEKKYKTFNGVADLYTYFIEKGITLLKPGGRFSYIVANKWMRTNYGRELRDFLKNAGIREIVDFGDLPVFEAATTYPCILNIEKENRRESFAAVNAEHLDFASLTDYVRENSFTVNISSLSDEGWSLTDEKTAKLLEKIKSKGVPLGEYVQGKIYRGVLTGLNEAFVIDSETRKKLIAEDPKSREIIKPFLAGRDIKRYTPLETDKYLIFTRRGIDIDEYPAIKKHLLQFKKALEPGTGRKPGNYKWYEIQDTVDYFPEFDKPKVIVPAIVNRASYQIDYNGYYSNDKTSIILSEDLFLLGVLNSKVSDFFLHSIASTKQGGYYEYKPMYVSQVPIFNLKSPDIISLVSQMLETHKLIHNSKTDHDRETYQKKAGLIDRQIDRLVYELYGLTEDEIKIVEGEG